MTRLQSYLANEATSKLSMEFLLMSFHIFQRKVDPTRWAALHTLMFESHYVSLQVWEALENLVTLLAMIWPIIWFLEFSLPHVNWHYMIINRCHTQSCSFGTERTTILRLFSAICNMSKEFWVRCSNEVAMWALEPLSEQTVMFRVLLLDDRLMQGIFHGNWSLFVSDILRLRQRTWLTTLHRPACPLTRRCHPTTIGRGWIFKARFALRRSSLEIIPE